MAMKKNVAYTNLKANGGGTAARSGMGFTKTATNRSTGIKTTTSGAAKAVTKSEFNGGMKKVAHSKAAASNTVLKTPKTGSNTSIKVNRPSKDGGVATTPGFKPGANVKKKLY